MNDLESLFKTLPGVGSALAKKIVVFLAQHPDISIQIANELQNLNKAGLCYCGLNASIEHPAPNDEGRYLCKSCASSEVLGAAIVPSLSAAEAARLAGLRAFVLRPDAVTLPQDLRRFRLWWAIVKPKTQFIVDLMRSPTEQAAFDKVKELLRAENVEIRELPTGLPMGESVNFVSPDTLTTHLIQFNYS